MSLTDKKKFRSDNPHDDETEPDNSNNNLTGKPEIKDGDRNSEIKILKDDHSDSKSIEVIQSRMSNSSKTLNEVAKGELGFILTDAVLNSSTARIITDEQLVGYVVPFNSIFQIDDGLKFRFEFKKSIPNLFSQTVIHRNSPISSKFADNPISYVLNASPPVIHESNRVYNSDTSIVMLELKPTNFGIDENMLVEFDQSLTMATSFIFVNTDPQQRVSDLLLSNLVLKLFTLISKLDFILYDIDYQTIGANLNNTSLGSLLFNKEILVEGQPHILTITTSFGNQNTVNGIRRALTIGSDLKVYTGVKEGTKKLVNSIPYRYDGYAFMDQYTAYINNRNCEYILKNKLTHSDYIREIKPFLTRTSFIVTDQITVYFDERVLLTKLDRDLKLNYVFSYFLLPGMHLKISDFIISQLGAINIITSQLDIGGMLNQGFGKTDSIAINDILGPVRSTPSVSILTLLACEAIRNVDVFQITGDITCTDSNLTTHLYNIYLCARFFPYCFSQLLYQYIPTLYAIIQWMSPSDMVWIDNNYGRYGKFVENKWERRVITSYTLDMQQTGIIPSIYGVVFQRSAPKLVRLLNDIIQPKFYKYELDRRRESGYPFITSTYVYQSSWPIGGPTVDEIANAYMATISTECEKINSLLIAHYKSKNGISKSISSTTIKALTTILQTFLTTFTEASTLFTRIIGPTFGRLFQNPLIPGTIVDVLAFKKFSLTQNLPSKRIGITAIKIDRDKTKSDQIGYTSGALVMQVNTMQFVNLMLSLTTKQGRGAIMFNGSDTNFDYFEVKHINPLEMYEFYLSMVESSRKICQDLYTFQIFIDPTLNTHFYDIIHPLLPQILPASLAKSILKFLDSKLKIKTEEIYTIYSSLLGAKILADPRSCRLQLGLIEGDTIVTSDDIPGTLIGTSFNLVDELYLDKLRLLTHMLTSDRIPNLQLGVGLAVGVFPTNEPRVTDYLLEAPNINYYDPNQTFKLHRVSQPGFSLYETSRLTYYYEVDDEIYETDAVELIIHKHTVICKYPTDIASDAQKEFLFKAAELDKIILIFKEVMYMWAIDLPQAIFKDTYVGAETIAQLKGLTYDDSTVKVQLVMHDGRDAVVFNPYIVTGMLIRRVLPIDSLNDNIIVSGLFDRMRSTEPYVHPRFFTIGLEDTENAVMPIDEFPNNDNLVRIHTNSCILDRPKVTIKYAKEFE